MKNLAMMKNLTQMKNIALMKNLPPMKNHVKKKQIIINILLKYIIQDIKENLLKTTGMDALGNVINIVKIIFI